MFKGSGTTQKRGRMTIGDCLRPFHKYSRLLLLVGSLLSQKLPVWVETLLPCNKETGGGALSHVLDNRIDCTEMEKKIYISDSITVRNTKYKMHTL